MICFNLSELLVVEIDIRKLQSFVMYNNKLNLDELMTQSLSKLISQYIKVSLYSFSS